MAAADTDLGRRGSVSTTTSAIGSSRLSISKTPIKPFQPYRVDAALVKQGKTAFAKLGCVKCHDDIHNGILSGVKAVSDEFTTLSKLDASKGCLSDASGPWPRFNLVVEQDDSHAVIPSQG